MSELSLEIRKLADKYRNSKSIHGEGDGANNNDSTSRAITSYNVEHSGVQLPATNFNGKDLDLLEEDSPDFEDFIDEDDFAHSEEIQISDFMNPKIDVAYNIEPGGEIQGDRRAISENLRNISRDLRNLKALLRS